MLMRILLLFGASWLMSLTPPLRDMWPPIAPLPGSHFSPKSLILILGGGFLIYKAVREMHELVEAGPHPTTTTTKSAPFALIITQIVLLDIVFSIDSVITAIGMLPQREHLWAIIAAVVLSFGLVMLFARPVGDFILNHPTLKILALSFLVTIGITITLEGLDHHVEKTLIYLPMGYALLVEMIHMRFRSNQNKRNLPTSDAH